MPCGVSGYVSHVFMIQKDHRMLKALSLVLEHLKLSPWTPILCGSLDVHETYLLLVNNVLICFCSETVCLCVQS